MKTKYVCRGLINLYVNFHSNWKMWSKNSHVKNCRWGGGGAGVTDRINIIVSYYFLNVLLWPL